MPTQKSNSKTPTPASGKTLGRSSTQGQAVSQAAKKEKGKLSSIKALFGGGKKAEPKHAPSHKAGKAAHDKNEGKSGKHESKHGAHDTKHGAHDTKHGAHDTKHGAHDTKHGAHDTKHGAHAKQVKSDHSTKADHAKADHKHGKEESAKTKHAEKEAPKKPHSAEAPKGKGPASAASSKGGKGAPAKRVPGYLTNGLLAAKHAAEAESVCREVACEGLATSGGYCRLHYIKNWKKIKRKELILKEGKLNQYIEELVAKYPDKYIEAIRQDLAHDKDFAKVIHDLDLDESVDEFDPEGEGSDAIIDSIKRDFDDDGDTGF